MTDPGLYCERFTDREFKGKPCLFLDRDGVIVEETHYLHDARDVRFIEGVARAVARVNAMAIPVVMVTNQAGIGRGLYGWEDFQAVQTLIHQAYRLSDAHFDLALACAYHAEGVGELAVADHEWRKPRPGMINEAERLLEVDLGRSFIVGDTIADLRSGEAAGLAGGALVETGHGLREWNEHGKAAFALWKQGGAFDARRASRADEAILAWLDRSAGPAQVRR